MQSCARKGGLAIATVALLFAVAACGEDSSETVTITGSSTVEPISTAVREAFVEDNDGVDVTVEGPGTSDGFEKFCAGDADINDASRPIDEDEIKACEDAGVEFIELEIGIDGLTVITHEDNPLDCLNFADLYALTGPEATGDNWTDAQELATELGSDTEFPDENLVITAPGEESGTYGSYIEIVFGDIAEARVEEGKVEEDKAESARSDYTTSANDNTIVDNVKAEPGGLGWVGFAFADLAEGVKKMPISAEPGGECVEPSPETIQDGTYPISRPLFIYVNKDKAAESEALVDYVDFYLEGLTGFVEGADYVALSDDAATKKLWADRTAGTQIEG
jgi:phosphate transport system substrate-binding protein